MSTAVLRAALPEAGWSHPVELLGRVHPHLAVEAAGYHRGLCGHRGLGTQPPVQVGTLSDILIGGLVVSSEVLMSQLWFNPIKLHMLLKNHHKK